MYTPTVSVCLMAYNHAPFVAESIRSVLDQSFADLELVIVDDGSTDDTPQVIASFDDPRIVSIRQPNAGPSAATNRALAACRGKYVALMTGDDLSAPHRIQTQLAAYQAGGPRVLCSDCDFIDDHGRPITGEHFLSTAFDTTPRPRAELLRRLYEGNFINAVSTFTETAILRAVGGYDPTLFQLQDYQMWITVLKTWPIEFVREPLVRYRIRGDGGNLSALTPATFTRHDNEHYLIMRRFFDGLPDALFREAFAADLRRPDLASPLATACEQAFLYLHHGRPELVFTGLERFQALFRDPAAAEFLAREFDFPLAKFVRFLTAFDPLGRFAGMHCRLYVDTGGGYSENDTVHLRALHAPKFRITADLSKFPEVRALRWDPIEYRSCSVQLEQVAWTDAAGTVHEVDLAAVGSNGVAVGPGAFELASIDPSIYLPVSGAVRSVTLAGRWELWDPLRTLLGVNRDLQARRAELLHAEARHRDAEARFQRTLDRRLRRAARRLFGPWLGVVRHAGRVRPVA